MPSLDFALIAEHVRVEQDLAYLIAGGTAAWPSQTGGPGNSTGGCSRRPELLAVKQKRLPPVEVSNYGSEAFF